MFKNDICRGFWLLNSIILFLNNDINRTSDSFRTLVELSQRKIISTFELTFLFKRILLSLFIVHVNKNNSKTTGKTRQEKIQFQKRFGFLLTLLVGGWWWYNQSKRLGIYLILLEKCPQLFPNNSLVTGVSLELFSNN